MKSLIKAVFDEGCSGVEADAKLAHDLASYVARLTHKNQDHINFFGGNLFGVDVVRFLPVDRDLWFDDIIQCDEFSLDDDLINQGQSIQAIQKQWEVSSDIMNLSVVWLLHRVYTSTKLKDDQKHEAMLAILLVLQFKFFTSRLYRYFKYPADRAIAEAAYAKLTFKYAIKQHGNWLKLFNARSEEILAEHSIHKDVIRKFDNDLKVVYMLNDIQGRIRDMLKNLYGVYIDVRNQGIKISSHSMLIEHDGEEVLRDKTNGMATYITYLNSVVGDQNSFIKAELAAVIEKMMPTMAPKHFLTTLVWISANSNGSSAGSIRELLETTLIHAFDYLSEDRGIMKNTSDLSGLLARLRGVYMSSRSTDPTLLKIREQCETMVAKATQNKNSSVLSSVRTGVLLYITLRAMTKRYYTT